MPTETRQYVTPYAFTVSEQLIGCPLASPTKRAMAILLDLLIVLAISAFSVATLAWCLLITGVYAWLKSPIMETDRWLKPALTGLIGLCLIVIVWDVFGSSVGESSVVSEASPSDSTERGAAQGVLASLDWTGIEVGLSLGWAAFYFTFATAVFNGQTLGKKLLGTRIVKVDARPLTLWQSFERYGGYSAGLATGLLGFAQIFWDANRQSIHDKIAETLVLDLRAQPASEQLTRE